MFYLTTHSTHFMYGYMASDIWLRTILIVRKETRCRHIGYSFRLTARVLLYAHPTDRIAHTTVFITPVVEHWLEREIAQWIHPMKDRSDDPSHHERMLLPRSYISLLFDKQSTCFTLFVCLFVCFQERHAAYIENHLLDQVRVVWNNQVLPVWVEKSVCLFLKIGTALYLYRRERERERERVKKREQDRRKEGNVLFNDALNTYNRKNKMCR